MTSRARGLTLMIGMAGLMAVWATTVVPPASAAPKDKPAEFTITITRWFFIDCESAVWEATGAIDGSGDASFNHEPYVFLATDKGQKSMSVDLHQDSTFILYGGSGKYKFGVAGGSYTEEWVPGPWPALWEDPVWTVTYVLEGTIDG